MEPRISSDLDRLRKRAGWIGMNHTTPVVSAPSLLLALLRERDRWSQWSARLARLSGVAVERIIERWEVTDRRPDQLSLQRIDRPPKGDEVPGNVVETRSAIDLMERARRDAAQAGVTPSVRHLVGAFIYGPLPNEDLAAWGVRRDRWAEPFFSRISKSHGSEVALYQEAHRPYGRTLSGGVQAALAWAASLARAQPVSALHLMRGILLDGAQHAKVEYFSSVWLLKALGGDVRHLLELSTAPPPKGKAPDSIDDSASQILDDARLFASASQDREVHVRHLILAALTSGDAAVRSVVLRGRRRPAELADEFLKWHLDRNRKRPADDEASLRELFGYAHVPQEVLEREIVLDSDSVGGGSSGISLDSDALGIRGDVRAMAAVLASSSLKPPLSVGLFGDWGSGKSFFMGLLRRRIADLAAASRVALASGQKTSFHGEIIQIEFNAWQYMDANLWASIVAHIFDQLASALRERDKPPATKYLSELTGIREEQEAVVREKTRLHSEITGLRAQIEKLESQRRQKQLPWTDMGKEILRLRDDDPGVKQSLDDLAHELGVDRAKLSVEEGRRLWQTAGTIAGWGRSIRRSPRKLLYVLVPVLLPTAVLLARQSQPAWIAQGTGFVVGALVLARQLISLASAGYQAFSRAMERVDAAEKQAREKLTEEEKRARTEEARIDSEKQKLEQRRAELSRRREELENKLAELKEAASYKRFVLDRASSSDYRSQLGLITTIHRDLKTLSEKLRTTEEPHVDRIILYIDDLDRCPPDRVVEVLQAVHLILSLELFVVVVAVDSRWLLQSLDAYYRRHFGERQRRASEHQVGHRESDPQHYLEKIFQIPYAVSPMTESGFGKLVRSLLGPNVARLVTRTQPEGSGVSITTREKPGTWEVPPVGRAQAATEDPSSTLTPRGLEMTEEELRNLEELGSPRLGRLLGSPRSVKRMVNLYRIVRAGLDEDVLEEFEQGGYKLHQLLLAAVVGAPRETAVLFDEIFEGRVTSRDQVLEYLSAQGSQSDVWRSLERAFSSQDCFSDWWAVVQAARGAGRFSFQTGRVLQNVVTRSPPP